MPKLYDLLTTELWWQGGRIRTAGQRCLFEAVIEQYGRSRAQRERVREVIRTFFAKRAPLGGLVEFNDHPDTTLADVLWVCHVADV
jgi:hypothetical protein